MSGFFAELQRRKVYRVAAAYIIAAGFIIQIGSAIFPAWELPNWTLRLVVVLLLVGFPVALILAWAYDVTPQGIQVTAKVPGVHWRRNIITLLAAGLAVSAVAGFFLFPRASGRNVEKSIAVLPFQSLSDEKENAYFADGMQDDILTNLSKIGDLKVISRMSVMSYRGDAVRNAREIGKALGVATLLEGSVRRIGNRVRVNVQLIDANNDEHIWAEDYDRDLTDVFAIQTDLAQKIASALQAKLSPNEKARLDQRPTQNPDAYLLFVQAHDYATQREFLFRDTSLKAEQLFEQAIKLDPNFAAAFAGLSLVESRIYHSFDLTPGRPEKARRNADEALRLQPALPEGDLSAAEKVFSSIQPETDSDGLMTMGRAWLLMLHRKLPEALQVVQKFRGETLFNTTTAPCPKALLEGEIYRLQGDEAKARTAFEHARVVSERLLREAPDDPARHGQHGLILAALGQKQEAIAEGKRAVELVPESQDAFDGPLGTAALAQIYAWTGEFDEAFRLLDHLLTVPTHGLTVPMLKLDPAWDPLRKDPRYQALIDKYAVKS